MRTVPHPGRLQLALVALLGTSLLLTYVDGGFTPGRDPRVDVVRSIWTVGWQSENGSPPPLLPPTGNCIGLNGTFNASSVLDCGFDNTGFTYIPHLSTNATVWAILIVGFTVDSPMLVQSWGNVSNFGCGCQATDLRILLPSEPGDYVLTGIIWFSWTEVP